MSTAFVITLLLLLPLLAASVIPSLPAVALMFVVTLVYGLATGFSPLTGWELAVFALIAIVAVVVDYTAGLLGAKYGGAHKESLIYGFAGTLAGTFLLPPFGGFLGLFVGIAVGEFRRHKDSSKAVKAAGSSLAGSIAGQCIIVLLAVVYFVTFLVLGRG